MAVQLILYPQVYNGYYADYTTVNTGGAGVVEYLGDPNFNSGLALTNGQVPVTSGYINILSVLETYPTPIGQWAGYFTTNCTNYPNCITTGAGFIELRGKQSGTQSNTILTSVVNNLVIGQTYRVTMTLESAGVGNIGMGPSFGSIPGGCWTENPTTGYTMNTANGNMCTLGGGGQPNGSGWKLTTNNTYYGNPVAVNPVTSQIKLYQDFTAASDTECLLISYIATTSTSCKISSLNINTPPNQSVTITDLYDGQVICDLYKDEAIPLNLSVDNFTNVAEKVASYSKSFSLPATKRNNRIFSHYFDVTRTQNHDPFVWNPFSRTKCVIKDDSVLIFEGFLKLNDITENKGEISYNVNCYSEPTTFCDYLKSATISQLDLAELEHDYDIDNVENSFTGELELSNNLSTSSHAYTPANGVTKTHVLKYPFCNWTGSYELLGGTDIHMNRLEEAFRPFINCKYLLDKMFEATPFRYTSNFLNSSAFTDLYMDFNWGGEESNLQEEFTAAWTDEGTPNPSGSGGAAGTFLYPMDGNFNRMDYPNLDNENPAGTMGLYWDGVAKEFVALYDGTTVQVNATLKLKRDKCNSMSTGVFRLMNDDGVNPPVQLSFNTIHWWFACTFGSNTMPNPYFVGRSALFASNVQLDAGDKLYFEAASSGGVAHWEQSINTGVSFTTGGGAYIGESTARFRVTSAGTSLSVLLGGLRGQMNQYDFWKGIKTMFNLVTIQDKVTPDTLIIEPYGDVFLTNTDTVRWDWTNKIDITKIKHKPLNKIPKRTSFTYADDDKDYRLKKYKAALGGYWYGTKEFVAGSQFFDVLTGEKKIEAKPFAPTMAAPLADIFPDFVIPHIYSANDEGTEFTPYENKPRILLDCGIETIASGTYSGDPQSASPAFSGKTDYLKFLHLSETPTTSTTQDINFGECPLVQPLGVSPVDNLFNIYYAPYYNELYNPDTRVLELKVNLTPADIQQFDFWDVVLIKNREYRVNKILYKSGDLAKVEFILLS